MVLKIPDTLKKIPVKIIIFTSLMFKHKKIMIYVKCCSKKNNIPFVFYQVTLKVFKMIYSNLVH